LNGFAVIDVILGVIVVTMKLCSKKGDSICLNYETTRLEKRRKKKSKRREERR
jgi:hypothetical protein